MAIYDKRCSVSEQEQSQSCATSIKVFFFFFLFVFCVQLFLFYIIMKNNCSSAPEGIIYNSVTYTYVYPYRFQLCKYDED